MNYECYRYKFVIHVGSSFSVLIDWSQKYELCVVVILPNKRHVDGKVSKQVAQVTLNLFYTCMC